MAKIYDFNLNEEECLDFAYDAVENGDVKKSLMYVHKALEINPDNTEANFYLASIYSDLNAFDFSNDVVFKILPKIKNAEEKERFYILLGANASAVGDYESATHFASQIDVTSEIFEDIEDVFDVEELQPKSEFYVAYPRGEEYYQRRLDEAQSLVKNKNINDALAVLDEFTDGVPLKDSADHLRLICYMVRDDFDAVIEYAERAIKKGGKKLAIKCLLITALLFENKEKEAKEKTKVLIANDEYESLEDLGVLLPLLVNLGMDEEINVYCKKFLKKINYHPQTIMWLAQSYFNLGKVEEAKAVMREVYAIYRDYLPSDYYMNVFESGEKRVEYSAGLPIKEVLNRQKRVKDFLSMKTEDAQKAYLYDKKTNELLKWVFNGGNGGLTVAVILKMAEFYDDSMNRYFDMVLHSDKLTFPELVEIIRIYLLNTAKLDFSAFVSNKLKIVTMEFNPLIKYMPMNFVNAVANVIADIVMSIDSPLPAIELIRNELDEYLKEKDGEIYFANMPISKMTKIKSIKTLAGVLIYKTEAFGTAEQILDRYSITKSTFLKYVKAIFG